MDVQTISVVVAAIGLLIAAINQIYTSRQSNEQREREIETRQAELFAHIYDRWTDTEFAKHYYTVRWEVGEQWKTLSVDEQDQLIEEMHKQGLTSSHLLIQFYEGIGVLVQEGLINVTLVKNLLSHRIIWFWETFGDSLIREREQFQDPTHHDSLEYLYNVMKQGEQ